MSSKDKFSDAVDHSIKKQLEKRQNILTELISDVTVQQADYPSESNPNPKKEATMSENTPNNENQKEKQAPPQAPKTGAGKATWNKSDHESKDAYAPSAKGGQPETNTPEADKSKNEASKGGNMKRIISIIALIIIAGALIYLWSPWSTTPIASTDISLSSQSFNGQASPTTTFKQGDAIFYKIDRTVPFDHESLTLKLYKIEAQGKKALLATRVEKNINPESSSFHFMLRPDYVQEQGTYLLQVFWGAKGQKDAVASRKFQIQ
jgi:DNA mismatch repair ATPase MutL